MFGFENDAHGWVILNLVRKQKRIIYKNAKRFKKICFKTFNEIYFECVKSLRKGYVSLYNRIKYVFIFAKKKSHSLTIKNNNRNIKWHIFEKLYKAIYFFSTMFF